MTSQITLYISSIFITFLLTGFLTWYAWRHRQVPGSNAYGWLALGECLLALTEILSVFSPSMTSALFWFQARYPIGAFIAVFWLVFALEYSGHREWLSKRLLAGMFVIPLVTQILFWSNSLHGLWMKQEAAFYQIGRLWIADISSRIPELGYMTHLFYNLFLTLAGITLMLLTAWRMRHALAGQALLLAGAGLTALFFVLNSLFGFLPKMEFNIFTPGIGMSVLLIALAVFRFDFLKRAPPQENALEMTRLDVQEKYSLAGFILIFILFTSGLAAVSYVTYHNYEKQFRAQVEGQLSAIAELKVSGLENWRAERMGDAETIHGNPAFAALAQRFLEKPNDLEAKAQLQAWMDALHNSYGYERVFLLDVAGEERLSSPATPALSDLHFMKDVPSVFESGEVAFLDFHRHTSDNTVHLGLLVPIYYTDHRPLAMLVLRVDPNDYLYPYLQRWPVPSESAETLLIRREGNNVLYLNKLRFQEDTALNLSIPLQSENTPSVKAAMGETGVVEGTDYRGTQVIADIHAVPNSPWFLVSKMDTAEMYAPLRARLWQTLIFFGALILLVGVGLMLVWRQQRVRFYRRQVEAAEALRESEQRLQFVLQGSQLGYWDWNLETNVVNRNARWAEMLGYRLDDIEFTVRQWIDFIHPNDQARANQSIQDNIEGRASIHRLEYRMRAKDGQYKWILDQAQVVKWDSSRRALRMSGTHTDVTERKLNEENLEASELRFRIAAESLIDVIYEWDLKDEIKWYGNIDGIMGCPVGEFPRTLQGWSALLHPEDVEGVVAAIDNQLKGTKPYNIEYRIRDGKNEWRWWSARGTALRNESNEPYRWIGSITDITERKQAEEALKESEGRWRRAIADSPIPIMIHDEDDRVLQLSAGWTKFSGYDINDIPTLADWTERAYGERTGFKKDYIDQLFSINQTVQNGEWIVTAKDGSKRIWDFQTTPLGKGSQGRRILHSMAIDITERKRAEEKYHAIFENAVEAITQTTPDGKYLSANPATARMLGYDSPEDLINGVSDIERQFYAQPGRREEFKKLMRMHGVLYGFESEVYRKDDSKVWISENSHAVYDEQGELLYYEGTGQDITERKQAEENLIVSEARYRRLFEAARDGILILDAETGIVVDVNPFLTEMLGFSQEEILGNELWELGFFKDIAASKANFLELQQKEYIRYEDLPLETVDGRRFYVEFVSNVYQVNHHKVIQCNIRDITERKQAEEKLRESEERLRLSLRAANQGMYDLNVQTGDAIVNEGYVLMLGYDPETFVETNAAWIERLHPDDKDTTAKAYTDYINGVTSEYRVEFRQKTRDGDWKWILSVGKIVEFDASGKPLRMLGTHTDITERKQAEEALQNYNVRLESEVVERTRELRDTQEQLVRQERLATLGQLAGGVGHELRNPLGVISNAVYYLKLIQPDAGDKVREYLNIIEKEIHASDKIVTDLLDFTRIKSLDRRPVPVSELVRQTLERYSIHPSIERLVELPADLPKIYADPQHVVQVLVNLVSNACQAIVTEKSTTGLLNAGKLTITAAEENDMIRIDVQDTGTGISPENMKRLFEPLFTTKSKGIGLGLAVSRKLIEANGGRIEVQSEVGIGATFTVYLPVKHDKHTEG